MNNKKAFNLILFLIFGAVYYLIYNNFILFNFSYKYNNKSENPESKCLKTVWPIYFFKNDKWQKEDINILFNEKNIKFSLNQIVENFLNIIYEEQIIKDKTSLQSILISYDNSSVYISFDRSPFDYQMSIYQKFQIINSIIKTLNHEKLQKYQIYFLNNHKTLDDIHIDFSYPYKNGKL